MESKNRSVLSSHPDYDKVIDEIIKKNHEKSIMDKALKMAKRESRAEALYVMLKLSKD